MCKLIVIFILSVFSISCRNVDSQKKLLKATQITDSLIVIINNTNNKQYLFKYIGYFGNAERIGFTKGDTLNIHSIKSITGYKANKPDFSDIRYYNLSPGDTLFIGPNEKFYSYNKSLVGKMKLMDELLFNASSINYTLKTTMIRE